MAGCNQDSFTASPELAADAATIDEEKVFFPKQVWSLWVLNSVPGVAKKEKKKVIIKKLVL